MSAHRLSATDGIWLSLESPETPMHVAFLLHFTVPDGDAAGFLRRWQAGLTAPAHLPPPWNLVPVPGRWGRALALVREVDEVDLTEHIHLRHSASRSEEDLVDLVRRIHLEPLDMRRPPWQIHLVPGHTPDRFALVLKVHHSLFDGVSLMRLFADTYSTDPTARDTPDLFTFGRANESDSATSRFTPAGARTLLELLRGIGHAAGEALGRWRGRAIAGRHAYRQPPSVLDGPIGPERDYDVRRYDLDLIKQLAAAAHGTVNDIVLYLVSTALRGYLGAHDLLPDRTLTAGVPTDLRAGDDDRLGTRAGMMFTALATDIPDPRARLTAVVEYITATKQRMAAMSPGETIGYGLTITLPWIAGLTVGHTAAHASHPMGISNVPGPRNPLYWNGARLESLYPVSLLMHGNSLNVTCVGYAGGLHFGVLGAGTLPPIAELTAELDSAVVGLTDLLLPGEPIALSSAG